MAKRKRLSPAVFSGDPSLNGPLETKSALSAPPISGIAQDAATTAALTEVTETLRAAREGGRMVLELPLDQIQLDHLVRDRVAMDPAELAALVASIRDRGQQSPIEVVALGPERYGLISGWRRCQAVMQLNAEQGEATPVLALLRQPRDASNAYLAMVEENEVRVGLSYYERARIALRAVEQGVFDTEKAALQSLFRSASRAKRSKIGSFLGLVRAFDGVLRFPASLGERTGLALEKARAADPGFAQALGRALETQNPGSPEAERAVIEAVLADQTPARKAAPQDAPQDAPRGDRSKQVSRGVRMIEHADGSITLKGPGVTKAMCANLERWLFAND